MDTSRITKPVLEGVKDRNLQDLKIALYGIIMSDRRMEDGVFIENLEYIEKCGINIREDVISKEPILSEEKNDFTDDDFINAAIYLSENFCDKRIEDVRKIGQAVYKKQVRNINPVTEKQTNNCQVRGITAGKKPMNPKVKQKRIIWGIAAAAAAVVVVGIIAIATK